MNKENILQQLEELAERLCIKVTYDSLKEGSINTRGGLCRVSGSYRILVDKRLTVKEKIDVIAGSLSRFDISQFYIPPEIRDMIINNCKTGSEQNTVHVVSHD
ncbi:MAG: hypothetical protein HZA06_02310 [Nitrospirae bacterium]|nr:hypothetical protein [Nitrospirota bacterium]